MTGRTGVVLAGGQSRRFGPEDKALAVLDGEPLLARVVDRVSPAVDEVIVSCRRAQIDTFQQVLSLASVDEIVADRYADAGPLAGIEAGFDAASGEFTAVVACDMPHVAPSVLEALFERAIGEDAAVPKLKDGHLQPVQAVYRTTTLRNVAIEMLPDGGSMHEAVDEIDVGTVPAERFPSRSFHNVNTRQDLAIA